ncbi:MAG: helix-turn-helix domain-containing protein [Anaeroplasmataceae bacterium]|nr:helix-turn-helix domain-containing protein [Anaeroplasmataceae bacterium]MDE6415383.1 helix-turn-helix domain-containing protein [Anaeroplasmataceae bacterium]
MERNKISTERIGQNFKKLLKKEGLTYEKFAELMPCNSRTVGRWVQNGIDDVRIILRIAEIFQIEVEDIMFSNED